MKNFRKHQRNGNATGTIVGIVVLIIGIVIYGNRQGFVSDELRHLIFSWPMLVTALGTILLVSSRFILGSILFVFGIASLIPNLKLLYPSQFDFLPTYSPINFDGSLFIILAGLFLIFSHIFRSGHSKKNIKIEFTNGGNIKKRVQLTWETLNNWLTHLLRINMMTCLGTKKLLLQVLKQ